MGMWLPGTSWKRKLYGRQKAMPYNRKRNREINERMKNRLFKEWMIKVEAEMDRIIGFSVNDLPDQPWRRWFNEGLEPSEAAHRAISITSEEMGFGDILAEEG